MKVCAGISTEECQGSVPLLKSCVLGGEVGGVGRVIIQMALPPKGSQGKAISFLHLRQTPISAVGPQGELELPKHSSSGL